MHPVTNRIMGIGEFQAVMDPPRDNGILFFKESHFVSRLTQMYSGQ